MDSRSRDTEAIEPLTAALQGRREPVPWCSLFIIAMLSRLCHDQSISPNYPLCPSQPSLGPSVCKNREEPRRTRCERRAGVSPCVSWSVPSRTRTIPHRGTVTYNPVFRKPHDGWSIHSPQHATSGVTGRLQQGPNFSFLWFCNPFAHFTVSGDLPKTPACSCQTVHEPSSRVFTANDHWRAGHQGISFPCLLREARGEGRHAAWPRLGDPSLSATFGSTG